jgi:hypothetical protein
MRQAYGRHLRDRMQIVKAARSASIRLKVSRINMADGSANREGRIMEGNRAARFLQEWHLGLPRGMARVHLKRRIPS